MATRTIRTGIGTYRDAAGLDRFGFLGDEVDVHDDDLERFDRLNPVENVEPVEFEEIAGGNADEGDPGAEDPGDLSSLTVAELKGLAADRGVDIRGATSKADILAALDS